MLCNIDASPVYPCVYREHPPVSNTSFLGDGLSLCVQGTHAERKKLELDNRFIPVCTGNTVLVSDYATRPAVYPCVYREHTNYNILFYN